MTVYVDDMRAKYGRMIMCHMIADTDEELHDMADKIGVSRKWWQDPKEKWGSHYDIALSKKALAIENGAVQITWRELVLMHKRREATGSLGSPETVKEWYEQSRNL